MPTTTQPPGSDNDQPAGEPLDWESLLKQDAEAAAQAYPDAISEKEKDLFDEKGVKRVYHYCLRGIVIAASLLFGFLLIARTFSLILPNPWVVEWLADGQIQVMDKVILSIGSGLVGRKIQRISES